MRLPRAVRLTIFFAVVAIIIAGGILGIRARIGSGGQAAHAQRAPVEATERILPFADGYIATDGLTVRCFGFNKSEPKWSPYSPDSKEREVAVSDRLIAMWREDSLHILDGSGNVKFNGTLESAVKLARCGNDNVVVYMPQLGKARVITKEGQYVMDIPTEDVTVLDAGFFTDQDMLWMLFLNSKGSAPSTVLRIYQPSKNETGGHTFDDQIVYDVLYNDNTLYATGTHEVNIINLATGDTGAKKPLVYGWQLIDSAVIGKSDVGLLFTLSDEGASGGPERLKLVRADGSETEMHLPAGCIDAFVGGKGVWGIAPGSIHFTPFGGATTSHALDFTIDEVVAKLPGNRLMVRAEGEMRLLSLPQ